MTVYNKLKLHLERNMYKRGAYKGDAPADQYKRYKTHLRVIARPGTEATNAMVVRMHNTDILTAYEDGSIMISTGGWWTSTTRKNLNGVLGTFVGRRMYVSGRRVFGMSQPTITRAGGPAWLFYDGITFRGDGELASTRMCFERKRADKDERAEFRNEVAKSGFKDAFPILYQSVQPDEHRGWFRTSIDRVMRDEFYANEWREVISLIKYPRYKHRVYSIPAHDDWRDAWKAINAAATKNMTEVVRTDVLYLP
jgi:hypothetical protein